MHAHSSLLQFANAGVNCLLLQVHLRDFFVWLVAFLVTTFAGVELGLMCSIILSIAILILEASFPHTAVLGRVGKSNVYRSVERYPDAHTMPGIVALRLDAPLFFANTVHFNQRIYDHLKQGDIQAREAGCKYTYIDCMFTVAHTQLYMFACKLSLITCV
eukprot:GHRR01027477.1.p1 GENE.GHRR01027477.1~~GHRR01027477.1.p1  ORF type:complete len:160 (+),score=32.59 GHRR01027477.1:197-676(+)